MSPSRGLGQLSCNFRSRRSAGDHAGTSASVLRSGAGARRRDNLRCRSVADSVVLDSALNNLRISRIGWGSRVLPVSRLWTRVFCEYYYGPDTDESLQRRMNEVAYFMTMLGSCVDALNDRTAFCVSAEQSDKKIVAGIAGRFVSDDNSNSLFLEEEWEKLAKEEFSLESGELLRLLYLWNFGVVPEERKKGIAQRVMEWIEAEARSSSGDPVTGICLLVYRSNRPAISLYEKLGYEVVDSWMDRKWMRQAEKNLTGVERKLLMVKHL